MATLLHLDIYNDMSMASYMYINVKVTDFFFLSFCVGLCGCDVTDLFEDMSMVNYVGITHMSMVNYVCINVEETDVFLTPNPSTDVFDDTSMVTLLHLDIQHSRSRKSPHAPPDEVWLVGERERARERESE
jgi:hypothetical protein